MKMSKVVTTDFTVFDNRVVRDATLSWKARGVFMYLWSLPDDWDFYETELVTHAKDGRDALRSALKELQVHGYLRRVRARDAQGRVLKSEWQLADHPLWATATPAAPEPVKPAVAAPAPGTPILLSPHAVSPELPSLDQGDEEEGAAPSTPVLATWCALWPAPNVVARRQLTAWLEQFQPELVQFAIETAGTYNVQANGALKYVGAILTGWAAQSVTTLPEAQRAVAMPRKKTGPRQQRTATRRREIIPKWAQHPASGAPAKTPPRQLTPQERAELQRRLARLGEPVSAKT
ncbi:DnaD domain protein [Lactiplantibacillus garii]|uniref:DnaD domain protein n=1 Tax=Lactiplantibacillus garii TaxID=2306423 RepID=A0A426D3Y4_9LACO|nr:DnaD domain protein [Lactiplantibacillus garii]RRK09375.1 DnaD domain protein [Lactiplantibacillus garii]